MVLPRRKFLAGLTSLIAAPAVIRVIDLMPVKAFAVEEDVVLFRETYWPLLFAPSRIVPGGVTYVRTSLPAGVWRRFNAGVTPGGAAYAPAPADGLRSLFDIEWLREDPEFLRARVNSPMPAQ